MPKMNVTKAELRMLLDAQADLAEVNQSLHEVAQERAKEVRDILKEINSTYGLDIKVLRYDTNAEVLKAIWVALAPRIKP